MRIVLFVGVLLFLASLPLAPTAFAKGQPHHVTITSPALAEPIVITYPETWSGLDPWKVELIDRTRPAMRERPQVGQWFRVAHYVTDHNNLGYQSLFSAYDFYADPSGGPGYVYWQGWTPDPFSAEPRWHYASAEWGALMHRVLQESAADTAASNLIKRGLRIGTVVMTPSLATGAFWLLRRRRRTRHRILAEIRPA